MGAAEAKTGSFRMRTGGGGEAVELSLAVITGGRNTAVLVVALWWRRENWDRGEKEVLRHEPLVDIGTNGLQTWVGFISLEKWDIIMPLIQNPLTTPHHKCMQWRSQNFR